MIVLCQLQSCLADVSMEVAAVWSLSHVDPFTLKDGLYVW